MSASVPTTHIVNALLQALDTRYPDANCALNHEGPLQLLVATLLSAQCTDVLVNKITPELFRSYPTAEHFATAPLAELEQAIAKVNFYRNKARFIQEACRKINENFGGQVPSRMEELLSLPGVARKTANVVLGTAFGKADGVVVDTHVMRVTRRLGLTRGNNRDKIEKDLMELLPNKCWTLFAHQIILHGRQVCKARAPKCAQCALASECPSAIV